MSGAQTASWWRDYRKRRATELREYNRERRQQPAVKAQRHASEQRRRRRLRTEYSPLAVLRPDLQRGQAVAFWEDELRLDLAQEQELALLEGRDPTVAVDAYRAREIAWHRMAAPLLEEAA